MTNYTVEEKSTVNKQKRATGKCITKKRAALFDHTKREALTTAADCKKKGILTGRTVVDGSRSR